MEMLYNCHHVAKSYTLASLCAVVMSLLALTIPFQTHAEGGGSLSLTIAPPLFQLNLQPGETWSSSIAVVNNNAYDISLYADPVLFKPSGESGTPVFIAPPSDDGLTGEPDTASLAGWITVPQGAFTVTREQTYNIPLTISVPKDASPGGHYAAVLIGNHAPDGEAEGNMVNVTSSIAALIFLSVAGDVVEKGRIRDFATEKSLYEKAEAHFSLRFENQGNVHLLPQGNIIIYNMFGKERGIIPVNHHKDYGSVLPESVRKFTFVWKSDAGFWDIGRYKAEATIGYGKDMKQSALATTYFYILPIVPLLQIIGGLLAFVLFIGWALRTYIRRALALESLLHKTHTETNIVSEKVAVVTQQEPKLKLGTLVKPIQAGFVDLRRAGNTTASHKKSETQKVLLQESVVHEEVFQTTSFMRTYRLFFVFVICMSISIFAFSVYFEDVTTVSREYTVSEIRSDGSIVDVSKDRKSPSQ